MRHFTISTFITIVLILTGCSTTTNDDTHLESTSNGSYKALLFVNGKELQSIGKTAEDFEVLPGELIGTVKNRINIEKRPKAELTSNYIKIGTEIYSVQGNPEIVLAKTQENVYEIFQ